MARYIDAEKLKIKVSYGQMRDDNVLLIPLRDVYKSIENAPTADVVERKKVKLLNANPVGECSDCGWLIDYRDGFNYCPNCGARMEGRRTDNAET